MIPWWVALVVVVATATLAFVVGGALGYMNGWEDCHDDVAPTRDDGVG